ncbi:MAG: cell division protein FtsZ, partial [Pseudomonadota bacterium]
LRPRITVIGVGGAGGNAVNNMIRLELQGVDFVVANTDAQALRHSQAGKQLQLGAGLTQGLGAGSRPDVGRAAAEEALENIIEELKGTHMAFVAAGMGGGTGTGAAPIIAKACRDLGILTVGVVTKPFQFEGVNRMRLADAGIQELEQHVDTLIVIPNQNLFRIANEKTTFADAFSIADDVLYSGVRSVTDLMVMPGLINLDFADVRAVMGEMGKAMMGTGEADGERRALDAAEAAIANPLIDDASMKGARGVLINITGGRDMTLFEVDEAANRIRTEVDEDAHIIFGAAFDQNLEGRIRVSVVATGINAVAATQRPAEPRLSILERLQAARPALRSSPVAPAAVRTAEPILARAVEIPAVELPTVKVAETPAAMAAAMASEAKAEAALAAETAELVSPPEGESVADLADTVLRAADQADTAAAPEAESAPESAPELELLPRRPLFRDLPRPAAMPQMGALDAFIPGQPAPARPSTSPAGEPRRSVARIEPVAPAASAPLAPVPAERPSPLKRASMALFERVTNRNARLETKVEARVESPRMGSIETESVVQTGGAAPRLAANPADRGARATPEDDLLDIPAFLRRQAN